MNAWGDIGDVDGDEALGKLEITDVRLIDNKVSGLEGDEWMYLQSTAFPES